MQKALLYYEHCFRLSFDDGYLSEKSNKGV